MPGNSAQRPDVHVAVQNDASAFHEPGRDFRVILWPGHETRQGPCPRHNYWRFCGYQTVVEFVNDYFEHNDDMRCRSLVSYQFRY